MPRADYASLYNRLVICGSIWGMHFYKKAVTDGYMVMDDEVAEWS